MMKVEFQRSSCHAKMKLIYIDSTYFDKKAKDAYIRLRFHRYCQREKIDTIIFSERIIETSKFSQSLKILNKHVKEIVFAPFVFKLNKQTVHVEDHAMMINHRMFKFKSNGIYLIDDTLIPQRLYLDLFVKDTNNNGMHFMESFSEIKEDQEFEYIEHMNKMKWN
ncbi:MAG: hypothetical protein RR524_05435 [Erysipelotrichaceae bacterium]